MRILIPILIALSVWACGAAKTPEVHVPIYSLDNRDRKQVVLRFRSTEDVRPVEDGSVQGSVCILPQDFANFIDALTGKDNHATSNP